MAKVIDLAMRKPESADERYRFLYGSFPGRYRLWFVGWRQASFRLSIFEGEIAGFDFLESRLPCGSKKVLRIPAYESWSSAGENRRLQGTVRILPSRRSPLGGAAGTVQDRALQSFEPGSHRDSGPLFSRIFLAQRFGGSR